MASYKELQTQASELGIKSVGVSKVELERLIEEAKSNPTSAAPSETPKKENEFNLAVVSDNGREVRRFTLEMHGEGFADIAKMYATKRQLKVELFQDNSGVTCPSCGHKFHLN
jgi:hypothetical protein